MTSLGDVLRARGLQPAGITAIRLALHRDDVSSDFPDIAAVARAGALGMYARMQDGPVIASGRMVLSFVALDQGLARLTAARMFTLRAAGNVPGDIVYDYDAAHLLHAFIARAAAPVFYDAVDVDGFDDVIGTLAVEWPEPLTLNVRSADDAGLIVCR